MISSQDIFFSHFCSGTKKTSVGERGGRDITNDFAWPYGYRDSG